MGDRFLSSVMLKTIWDGHGSVFSTDDYVDFVRLALRGAPLRQNHAGAKPRPGAVNCDLPVVEEMVRDPQLFFRSCDKPVVVFDGMHQLRDPGRLLKISADLFPNLKILATDSSTLASSAKFPDTLTGRKRTIHLLPVTWDELSAFGIPLQQRLYRGGLPPALLAETKKPSFYCEWLDSFFARDIQRLFGFRDMNRFNALYEYLLHQSGGQFEVTRTAATVGITNKDKTITNRNIPKMISQSVISLALSQQQIFQ